MSSSTDLTMKIRKNIATRKHAERGLTEAHRQSRFEAVAEAVTGRVHGRPAATHAGKPAHLAPGRVDGLRERGARVRGPA